MYTLDFKLFAVLIACLGLFSNAQNYCDEEYGVHCPEESGWNVGSCLKKSDKSLLSAKCVEFINLHDSCEDDIKTHCAGNVYTGDLLPCLTEWTKPEVISEACKEAFPKKEERSKKLSKEEKAKADKRRKYALSLVFANMYYIYGFCYNYRIRKASAKMAREF